MKKVNYGFDAPAIMRNLLIFGCLITISGFLIPRFTDNTISKYVSVVIGFLGIVLFFFGVTMVAYGLKGKYRVRALMLSKIEWKGNENVLDIGAGTGLVMNGAATKLTTGKSMGIDIWRAQDLSDNIIENTLKNAVAEGVKDKIEILTEDARKLSFADNSFDVILSQFCIHNIEDKKEQEQACFEIARVLKPNGTALIGDYLPTHTYAKAFEKAGLKVISSKNYFKTALSLTWIVEATKI